MIDIDGKYVIKAEKIDYSAWEVTGRIKKDKSKGNSYPRNILIGYYSSVGRCVEAIKEYEVHKCIGADIQSLESALTAIKSINDEFKEKIDEFSSNAGLSH